MINRKFVYEWYLGTAFWRAKRDEAMVRAKGICQLQAASDPSSPPDL